jgi:hypothetical protein
MSLAVGTGGPTTNEIERLRLILSTYQDSSGMLVDGERNLPGWRDFERTVAQVFGGKAVESKAIFDVRIPFEESEYGISCKMRATLDETNRTGRVTIELSNSSAKFAAAFKEAGIDMEKDFRQRPDDAGRVILATVAAWHVLEAGSIDLDRSSYLALSYNGGGDYQLHQFTLHLPNANSITWSFPDVSKKNGATRAGKRLQGNIGNEKIIEFYYGSGGQLKYYPRVTDAIWASKPFQLESLEKVKQLFGAQEKAAAYFRKKWKTVAM